MSKLDPQLTILTVSYKSADLLRLNLALVNSLNSSDTYRWLIVENTAAGDPAKLPDTEQGFSVIQGPPHNPDIFAAGSYHHAEGLNLGIEHVDTPYVLVLDPDFFITRKAWMENTIAHMQKQQLAFLGVPWNPGRPTKFRYFPAVHCMFIDLTRISKESLDFRPDHENSPGYLASKSRRKHKLGKIYKQVLQPKRLRIGSSRDTGWKIYDQYYQSFGNATECMNPVYRPNPIHKFLDSLLPEQFSIEPGKKSYCVPEGYEKIGYRAIGEYGWEQFCWQQSVFGFHIRSSPVRAAGEDSVKQQSERAAGLIQRMVSDTLLCP